MSPVSSSEYRDRHEGHCSAAARYPPAAAFRTALIRIGFCAARQTGRERKSDLDQGAADAGCDVVPPTQDTASFRPRHHTAAPMFRAFSPDRRRRTSLRRRTAHVALIKINEQLPARRRLLRLNEPKGPASGKAIAMPKEVPPPSLPLQDGSEACELDNSVPQFAYRAALAAFFKIHAVPRRLGTDRVLPDFRESALSLAMVTSGMLIAGIDLPDHRRQILFVYCPGDVIVADALTRVGAVSLRALSDVELSVLSEGALGAARRSTPSTVQTLLEAAVGHLSDLMLHSAALERVQV